MSDPRVDSIHAALDRLEQTSPNKKPKGEEPAPPAANTTAEGPAHDYDLIVIGGGSGGSATVKRALGYGKKVMIIERGASYVDGKRVGAGVGGTCVNVGCVPKKIMFMAASVRETMVSSAELATGFGFADAKAAVGAMTVDWEGLKARRDAYVGRLNGIYEGNWSKMGATVEKGFASLVAVEGSPPAVHVDRADGTQATFTADHVLVAVGGEPAIPDVPGAELGISSDGFFDLEHQPKKCAVIGAGYIAVEMAGILNAMGTDTHLLCRGDRVLRNENVFDKDIVDTLMAEMANHGPSVVTGASSQSLVKQEDGSITLTMVDGRVIAGLDCVLWAIGRHSVTSGIGLEECGVGMSRDKVTVDEYQNVLSPDGATVSGLYCVGDCCTLGFELTPVAIAAGRRLADRLFTNTPTARFIYEKIPTVIFSHPPIGTIGMTEAAARTEFGDAAITVRKSTFGSMLFAFNDGDEHKVKTTLKLVLNEDDDERVLGLHLIGPYSDEMLQGFSIAIKMNATLRDFESVCAIHPTIGEEMVTFGGWGQKNGIPQLPPQLD